MTPEAARPSSVPAVRAKAVGKAYPLRPGLGPLLGRSRVAGIPALAGVDLEVPAGSALGLVGANGAGKSTLLRLLAGLARPTSGALEVAGRVASLLDLGAGLVDDWTGAENAARLGALTASSPAPRAVETKGAKDAPRAVAAKGAKDARRAVEAKGAKDARRAVEAKGAKDAREPGDAVAWAREFADLGPHWSVPVRTYSSGMRLRLAYAIAAARRPDLLVVDEVIAVGDEAFQRRCTAHVLAFLDAGGTMVFASHNLYLVEHLCDAALWLDAGAVAAAGEPRAVVAAYRAAQRRRRGAVAPATGPIRAAAAVDGPYGGPDGDGSASCAFELLDQTGRRTESLDFAAGGTIALVGRGRPARLLVSDLAGSVVAELAVPAGSRSVKVPGAWLLPGLYGVSAGDGPPGLELEVRGRRRELGSTHLAHRWEMR